MEENTNIKPRRIRIFDSENTNSYKGDIVVETWSKYLRRGIARDENAISRLEKSCWPAFIAASPETLKERSNVFPNGQFCIPDGTGGVVAILATNLISWNGDPSTLGTWDQVAGKDLSFRDVYQQDGNTLCLLSMSIDSNRRGENLPEKILGSAAELAEELDLDYIIVPARPTKYAAAVKVAHRQGTSIPNFEEYVTTRNSVGELIDPWLRVFESLNMNIVKVIDNAMVASIDPTLFQSTMRSDWELVMTDEGYAWWIGETGFVYPDGDGGLVYREKNVWCVHARNSGISKR